MCFEGKKNSFLILKAMELGKEEGLNFKMSKQTSLRTYLIGDLRIKMSYRYKCSNGQGWGQHVKRI